MKPIKMVVVLVTWLVFGLMSATWAQNRIAFVNPSGQLVTTSPNGSDSRVLTPPGRSYQFPAWSPVENTLAAAGIDNEGGCVFSVQDRADAETERLYGDPSGAPIYLYWAPDGKAVGFLANTEGGLGLRVVGTDGAEARQLLTGNPIYWQWSGDSARLLVHSGGGSAGRVSFYRAAGGAGEPLAEPGPFNAPGLSTSGTYRAYAEFTGSVNRVVLAGNRPRNAELRREVPYEGVAALSWSPVAEQLAIMNPPRASPRPYGPIRLLDADTGDLTPLVDTAAVAFFWSPDGNYIAYLTPVRRREGQQADAARRATFVSATGSAQPQTLLELNVVEVATGRSRLLTAFAPTPLFVGQFLPFFDQYALSHSVWSPESDAVVLPMLSENGPQIVVVPLEGKPETIAQGEMPFWSRR